MTELGLSGGPFGNVTAPITNGKAARNNSGAWEARHPIFRYRAGFGLSERRVGAALCELPRDEVVIYTKEGRLLPLSCSVPSVYTG